MAGGSSPSRFPAAQSAGVGQVRRGGGEEEGAGRRGEGSGEKGEEEGAGRRGEGSGEKGGRGGGKGGRG
eukprot:752044-Hanusia_phi.AAC.2